MLKKLGKKKQIILLIVLFLLLLTGVGAFFLIPRDGGEEEVVMTSDWDISWYDESKDEFIITTKEQLFGFSDLTQWVDFAGKTVKLGNDIVINEGNAKDWEKKKPEMVWNAAMNFAGTFDGQGNTISGLYASITKGAAGLFAETKEDSEIKDFRLVNSYIYSQTSKGTGSIVGSNSGLVERVYTDAIVSCNGFYCGGIVGHMKDDAVLSECWYDGALTINGACAGGIAGAANDGHSKMMHCLNSGTVTSTYIGPDPAIIGGVVGAITKKIDITDTLNVGMVVSENELEQVGGLFGMLSGGTAKIDALWTARDVAPDRVGYAKSGFEGAYGDCRLDQMIGVKAYQKMNLDYEKHWAIVEDGTPVLQYFAETVPEIPEGLERAIFADTSWFDIRYNTFEISTPEQLLGLGRLTEMGEGYGNRFTKKEVVLMNDIVFNTGKASNWDDEEPLNEWLPIYNFTGTFNGQGHTISGLYAVGAETAKTGTGFFAYSREMTVIENLKITNSYFSTNNIYGLGGVVGRGGGTIRSVYTDVILENTEQGNIGGIFGFATRVPVIIENCWSDSDITTGGRRVGGMLGNGNGRTDVEIKHCLNTGTLTRTFKDLPADSSNRNTNALFGGIVGGTGGGNKTKGYTGEFLIEDCFNAGKITTAGEKSRAAGIGGAVTGKTTEGEATVTVKNCYTTKSCCDYTFESQNVDAVVLDAGRLPDEMLTGAEAYFYTALNFKQYWTALDGKTPVLKTFAAGQGKKLAVSGERVDTSWYKAGKTEFTIKTKAQLLGFMVLSCGGDKFQNKTIKLGADIVVNEGNAADWAAGTSTPKHEWIAIYNLLGSFDGQGHTISGLYSSLTGPHADRAGVGMFSHTRTAATIQNLTLRNSCFKSTYANGVSAISARGSGTFRNIHVGSDVYLSNPVCGNVGGILGIATQTDTDSKTKESTTRTIIENCWSEAQIKVAGQGVGGIVGNGNAQVVTIKNCLHSGTLTRSFAELDATLKLYDYAENKGTYTDSRKLGGYFGGIIGRTGGGKKDPATGITAYTGNIVVENCVHVGTVTSERENDAVGGIVGHVVGLTADKKPALTITNAYCTTSSCAKITGNSNADAAITNCLMLSDNKLKGLEAFYNTNLDFNKYWSARKSTTPMLTYFLTSADAVESVAGLSKQQFTLVDNKGYIANANQLEAFRNNLNDGTLKVNSDTVITLTADIVLNEGDAKDWAEGKNLPEDSWTPINKFTGKFDGAGHSISGLYVTTVGGIEGTGLFTNLNGGTIQNLVIKNSYINGSTTAGTGALVGRGHGTISDVAVNAIFASAPRKTGGIIGCVTGATTISNCWNAGDITTAQYEVGGILGGMSAQADVNVNHCLNTGDIETTKASGNAFLGGIAGMGNASSNGGTGILTITDCMNAGAVDGSVTSYMGALVANNGKVTPCVTVTNSVAVIQHREAGTVIGKTDTFIGAYESTATITDCVAVDQANVLGNLATTSTPLDFTTYWTTRENDVPVLTTFKDIASDFDPKDETVVPDNIIYISNASELMQFAADINSGAVPSDAKAKLTANIDLNEGWTASATAPTNVWIPIQGYTGIFDGDGYTVSGLYITTVGGVAGTGMFTGLNGGVIQNLVIKNSYIKGTTTAGTGALVGCGCGIIKNVAVNAIFDSAQRKTGGIIGAINGTTTISNCWNASDITTAQYEVGGILGGMTAQANINVDHCLNTGDLTSERNANTFIGGIAGQGNASSNGGTGMLTITDCMNAGVIRGTVKETYMGALVGNAGKNTGSVTINNSCAVIQYDANGDVIGKTDTYVGAYPKNAAITDCVAAGKADVLGNLATTNTTLDFTTYWTTRENDVPVLTTFKDIASTFDPNEGSGSEGENPGEGSEPDDPSTIYIGTADELISFANGINDGSVAPDSKVALKADINLNEGWTASATAPTNVWTPIKGFTGTFDGKGHTISGMYVTTVSGFAGTGMFTELNGGTIQNLVIKNSYVKGTTTAGTGALVGCGNGTITNVAVNAVFDSAPRKTGGIIGCVNGATTISNCWNASDITSAQHEVGGILGGMSVQVDVNVNHCLNTGNLTSERNANTFMGGIAGQGNASSNGGTGMLTITDCMNAGVIRGTVKETYMGALVGNAGKNTGAVTINNSCAVIQYDANGDVIGKTDTYIGAYQAKATITGCVKTAQADVLGNLATTNTPLDFTTNWTTRENDVPMLKAFKDVNLNTYSMQRESEIPVVTKLLSFVQSVFSVFE